MPWNQRLQRAMGHVTHLVRSGHLAEATRSIQQALAGGAAGGPAPAAAAATGAAATANAATHRAAPTAAAPAQRAARAFWRSATRFAGDADVQDAVVIDRARPAPQAAARHPARNTADGAARAPRAAPQAGPAAPARAPEAPGSFTRVPFAPPGARPGAHAGQHHYHLYVPPGADAAGASAAGMPLVLMLHGCTQNPADFATGTGMNRAAAPAHALVLYPEQPHSANPKGCWNWFRPEDQRRGGGEPALLVAMVRDVMARHPVDARRVYVAGLSAGGAMAALLAREYPDVFAAAGVHSGLQAGAAHNVMEALSAMKSGAKGGARVASGAGHGKAPVPVIAFHGDADATVSARNGEQVIGAALGALPGGAAATHSTVEEGRSAAGQAYTRTLYRQAAAQGGAAAGPVVAEHWLLHGAGHAWSGGNAQGSHTDPRGVDASAQMLRFFLEHSR